MTSNNNQIIESDGAIVQHNLLNVQEQKIKQDTGINRNSSNESRSKVLIQKINIIFHLFVFLLLGFAIISVIFACGISFVDAKDNNLFTWPILSLIGLEGLTALYLYIYKTKKMTLAVSILEKMDIWAYLSSFVALIYLIVRGFMNLMDNFLESSYIIFSLFLCFMFEASIFLWKYPDIFKKPNDFENRSALKVSKYMLHLGIVIFSNLIIIFCLVAENSSYMFEQLKIYCWIWIGIEFFIFPFLFLFWIKGDSSLNLKNQPHNSSTNKNQNITYDTMYNEKNFQGFWANFWSRMQLHNKNISKMVNITGLVLISIIIGYISINILAPLSIFKVIRYIEHYDGSIDSWASTDDEIYAATIIALILLICQVFTIFLYYTKRNSYNFIINKFENLITIGVNFIFILLCFIGLLEADQGGPLFLSGILGLWIVFIVIFGAYIYKEHTLKQSKLISEIDSFILGNKSEENKYALSLKGSIKQTKLIQHLNRFIAGKLIKQCIKKCEKAKRQEKLHSFNSARKNWKRAFLKFGLAIKKNPTLTKKAMISDLILVIQKYMGMTYFSESIYLSSEAWITYEHNDYKNAFKIYKSAHKSLENAIKFIEKKERKTIKFVFPIKNTTLHTILKLYKGIMKQIEIEMRQKRQANIAKYISELKEIFDVTHKSLEELNQTLWIYCDTFFSNTAKPEQSHIEEIMESKLGLSIYNFTLLQERIDYLIEYFQTPEFNKKLLTESLPAIQFNVKNKDLELEDIEENAIKTKSLKTEDQKKTKNSKFANQVNNFPKNQEKIEDSTNSIRILREYEYIGGKIRFKVGLLNKTRIVITNLALRFDLPSALKWIILEPNYEKRGDTILIPKLGGDEKIALSLYLEPINCLESAINATLTYFDANDHPQALIMPPKKVFITCPIFFTREDANLARVKKLHHHLKYNDQKIFPLAKQKDAEIVFNHILDTISTHDIKLVHQNFSSAQQRGEAWYYGITKVKQQKMIIHINLDSTHHILAVKVNGDNPESITGLLAELEGQIREKLLHSKIINNGTIFNDISTSILLGHCPYCNGPISAEWIGLYKKGEIISCKYCDSSIHHY